MQNSIKLIVISASVLLSGCIATIGKEEFTCGNLDKGGVCAGPRDIYELTNNRESLENLSQDDLNRQLRGDTGQAHHNHAQGQQLDTTTDVAHNTHVPHVYHARDNEQQQENHFQGAELVAYSPSGAPQQNAFEQWPSNGQPMAPEALAMMEQPKPMRIMINSYTDANGFFHVPGFVYVNTQKETWIKGSSADLRPTRVVPLELQQKSQEGVERINRQQQGVSPLGVVMSEQ